MNGRRIFDAFRQARGPKPDAGEWMTLAAAAGVVHAAEQGSDLDRMSRGLSQSEDNLLMFWARRVAQIGVPVYGRRIMATKLEIVPESTVLAGKLIDGATRLEVRRGTPIEDIGALQVKRRDLDAALKRDRGAAAPPA